MSLVPRRTLAREAALEGVGLHSGALVRLVLRPAKAGEGIAFERTDLPGTPRLGLGDVYRDGPPFRTALKAGAAEVHTIEHLLSALAGLGLTDLRVALDGPEVPGLDGSALPFVEALSAAGVTELPGPGIEPLVVTEAIEISDGPARIEARPSDDGLTVRYTLDYPGEPLAQGTYELRVDAASYRKEIAPARTFCLRKEAEALQAAGFGLGAGTHNTLVLDGGRVLEASLRFPDEPVRHKILDLLGDLYILGRPLRARVVAQRSGHRLNRALAERLAGAAAGGANGGCGRMVLDIQQIREVLPHRYPFLLVDRILEMEPGKRIVGLKNVTFNEHFFQGHFPGEPVMPGVLIIEALAQCGAFLVLKDLKAEGRIALFAGMDEVKFRRKVVPGDQLRLECEMERVRPPFGRYKTRALVEGELAAEAILKFMVELPGREGKT